MIAKLLLQNLVWVVVLGALLFVPAGTLHWPAAWVFLATLAVLGVGGGLWLARTNPALLAERMHVTLQDAQPAADKAFMLAFGFAALIWFIAMGLGQRRHGPDLPAVLQPLGLLMMLLGTGFAMWVMRENSFAAPVIKVQRERGHHVVSSGPYAFVRHPMYSGAILFFIGVPLLLSSLWGLAISPLLALLFAIRAKIEERALIADLPGYGDYLARVRYRLFPGVW